MKTTKKTKFEKKALQEGTTEVPVVTSAPLEVLPAETSKPADALSVSEKEVLAKCEQVIDEGLATSINVAIALKEIREKKLYRETGETFEEYCDRRFGISRQTGARLVKSATMVENIKPCHGLLPKRESHFRELALAGPDKWQEGWERSVTEAGDQEPTAAIIRKCIEPLRKKKTNGAHSDGAAGAHSKTPPPSEIESESDAALTRADQVLTFLKGGVAKNLDKQKRHDWTKVLDQIQECRKSLGL